MNRNNNPELLRELERLKASLDKEKEKNKDYRKTIRQYKKEVEELTTSKERFKVLFEKSSDITIVINQKGYYTYVSPSAVNYGIEVEHVVGKHYKDLVCEKYHETLENHFNKVLKHNRKTYKINEFAIKKPDGSIAYFEGLLTSMLEVDGVEGIAVYCRDITLNLKTEKALRRSKENYRNLFENAPIGFFHSTSDGKFLRVNLCLANMLGYESPEELIKIVNKKGISETLYVNKDKRDRIIEYVNENNDWKSFENDYRRKDGKIIKAKITVRAVKENGELSHLEGIVEDITERKKSEIELRKSEKKYRDLFNNLRDGVGIVDLEGNYLGANPAYLELVGYSLEELKSETYINLTPEKWLEPEKKYVKQIVERGFSDIYEKEYIHKDGNVIPIELRSYLTTDLDGNPDGMVGIARDITERKKTDEMLLDALRKAEEANQLKSMFLANMSHELRTPLNSIIGFCQILTRFDFTVGDMKQYIRLVYNSAEHLLNIISDLLDISKIEAGMISIDKNEIDLFSFLEDIKNLVSTQILDKDIGIDIHIDENVPDKIFSDSLKLKQILINLLGNAIKFTERGIIKIIVELHLNTENQKDDEFLLFSIIDSGIGIPEDKQKVIFDSFVQVDGSMTRKHGGTGLGLSISKRFIELLDGKIWLESEYGKGTTFYFTIKLCEAQKKINEFEKNLSENNVNDANIQKKILLVEDDVKSINFIELLMKKLNLNIITANNGEEAVKLTEKYKPDLILMDIQLPVMDGIEATKEIRNNSTLKNVPIIAMTAFAMKGDRERFLEDGCDDYISKPINIDVLSEKVKKHLGIKS